MTFSAASPALRVAISGAASASLALVGVDDGVEVLGQASRHAPLEFGAQRGIERLERLDPGRARSRAPRAPTARQAASMSSGTTNGS